MPFMTPQKRHTIASSDDLYSARETNARPIEPVPSPHNLDSAYDRSRQSLHQDDQTYDALVGRRDQPLVPVRSGPSQGRLPISFPLPFGVATSYPQSQDQYRSPSLKRQSPPFRDRVTRQAPIVIHLRTNVIVKDEYTLVTETSQHMSIRYAKPQASVMITIDHSTCLLLGATFEPAYILAITALPSELQPESNRQNISQIQSFMGDILGVSPERGIVNFVATSPENYGTNGTTISGAIDRLQRAQKLRHSTMPSEGSVNGSLRSSPSRNSGMPRPRTMLEPALDPRPAALRRDSSYNQDRRWQPVGSTMAEDYSAVLAAEQHKQNKTPSPPPPERSPRRQLPNPLNSNPPPISVPAVPVDSIPRRPLIPSKSMDRLSSAHSAHAAKNQKRFSTITSISRRNSPDDEATDTVAPMTNSTSTNTLPKIRKPSKRLSLIQLFRAKT